MKNSGLWVLMIILVPSIFFLGFGYQKSTSPNNYYQVYLNEELLGTIKDKKQLEEYIDKEGESIKRKYNVSNVYAPNGLQIQKVTTYSDSVDSISKVYQKIKEKEPFTIRGYQFKIKKETKEKEEKKIQTTTINVLDKDVFKDSIESIINIFVGEEKYKAYIENNQVQIETTGETIQNVYLEEDVTVKETNISAEEEIYTTTSELSKYFLFGNKYNTSIYKVQAGDTVDEVAFKNKVSIDELLISNETLTSSNNLLFPGQELIIAETSPQISVVTETYVVKDVESEYKTEEQHDSTMMLGDEKVTQEGEKGLVRVTQTEKKINGILTVVAPKSKDVLKEPKNKIVVKGSKYIPTVGSLTNWGWPTDSGWTLSSGYSYRNSPFGSGRELHTGLDIIGTGYGSKIYATNNGVVYKAEYHYSYGNHVVINHNNGYYTLYAHMSRIGSNIKVGKTVAKGQVIGYVGSTGASTGPHVHYEVWRGCDYCHVNPGILYPGGYR